ncbi:MAG: transcriptional repressor LexA [Gammaproteobacteria bacterium]|nr:MAG: transcriptional repressor LexA [Gammaproteobacteria bacterium]
MKKLTNRQQQVLDFISSFINDEGYPPTRSDICKALGFRSPNAAEDHLKALQKKGVIELQAGSSRGIRIVHSNQHHEIPVSHESEQGIPLVGMVAAGSPILAQEHITQRYAIDESIFPMKPDYLLKVSGNSMINIGIYDDDFLVVHKTNQVRNGQIVVARLEDEVTVKRFEKQGNTISLIPENDELLPITIDSTNEYFAIEGLGIGVIRNI